MAAGPVSPNLLSTTPNAPNLASLSLQFTAAQLENSVFGARPVAKERQLGHLGMTASYIWSRGVQLYGILDLNLPALGSTSFTYTIADSGNPREVRILTNALVAGLIVC